ncbi:hypothetical protein D9619_012557 [Psilocybe cf. subviscida]|uniref:Potassium channel domain-containing protein n=1 Tax=Psilocybe cf. subviscida TaxID=2480587 RepID=A0A8H5B8N1_9AGAR|nr:hypothetical protein D9619_012557 [Psilocybe cf. subviscida]
MSTFYGVIDLLSVLPYYLELLLQQDTSVYFRFSILRMFRLLRVFRPFRYNHTILLPSIHPFNTRCTPCCAPLYRVCCVPPTPAAVVRAHIRTDGWVDVYLPSRLDSLHLLTSFPLPSSYSSGSRIRCFLHYDWYLTATDRHFSAPSFVAHFDLALSKHAHLYPHVPAYAHSSPRGSTLRHAPPCLACTTVILALLRFESGVGVSVDMRNGTHATRIHDEHDLLRHDDDNPITNPQDDGSHHALLAIGFFVFMILTVFSTLLYFAERGTWDELLGTFVNVDGDPTQFSSIPAAAWFVLVTITTVGYGEITPRSFLGRLITLPILVFGLLLITLPSFVLGREFSVVWEGMTRGRKLEAEMEASRAASAENVSNSNSNANLNGRAAGEGAPEDEEDSENTPLTRGARAGGETGASELGAGAWRQHSASREALPTSARPTTGRDPLYSPVYSAMPSGLRLPAPYSAAGDYGFSMNPNMNGAAGPPSATPSPGPESGRNNTQPYAPYSTSYDPASHQSHSRSRIGTSAMRARDLTNLKLAQNQTELSRQIEELASAVQVQGRLLARLVERLAAQGGGPGLESDLVIASGGTGRERDKERDKES